MDSKEKNGIPKVECCISQCKDGIFTFSACGCKEYCSSCNYIRYTKQTVKHGPCWKHEYIGWNPNNPPPPILVLDMSVEEEKPMANQQFKNPLVEVVSTITWKQWDKFVCECGHPVMDHQPHGKCDNYNVIENGEGLKVTSDCKCTWAMLKYNTKVNHPLIYTFIAGHSPAGDSYDNHFCFCEHQLGMHHANNGACAISGCSCIWYVEHTCKKPGPSDAVLENTYSHIAEYMKSHGESFLLFPNEKFERDMRFGQHKNLNYLFFAASSQINEKLNAMLSINPYSDTFNIQKTSIYKETTARLYYRAIITELEWLKIFEEGLFSKEDASPSVKQITELSGYRNKLATAAAEKAFELESNLVERFESMVPKTQKVKGVLELMDHGESHYFEIHPLSFHVVLREADLDLISFGATKFARPCPVTPRHGFVDSRPVNSKSEAKAVFKEAREADPKAEMLVGEFIDAHCNMIWANGMLTVGPGHDGATAGRDSIVFPTVNKIPLPEGSSYKWKSIKDSAFFEFVTTKQDQPYYGHWVSRVLVTQLRDGPNTGRILGNYIPEKVVVKQVVEAVGDLLEWEQTAKKFKKGTVVWHPGGSVSSHYSIHSYNNNIPIVYDKVAPKVGDVLKPTGKSKAKDYHKPAFIFGATCALRISPEEMPITEALKFVLAVLHNFTAFDKGNEYHAALLGAAAMLCVRLGFCASIGEARHSNKNKGELKNDRTAIYKQMWRDFNKARELVPTVLPWFYDKYAWSSGGYGGPKWFKCLYSTIELWNRVCLIKQNKGKAKEVIDALNVVINAAHNNGRFLNKFASTEVFDGAANAPSCAAIAAGPAIYSMTKFMEGVRGVAFKTRFHQIPCEFEIVESIQHKKGYHGNTSDPAAYEVKKAQCNIRPQIVHIQYTLAGFDGYQSFNVSFAQLPDAERLAIISAITYPRTCDKSESWAGSSRPYVLMSITENRYLAVWSTALDKWLRVWDIAEAEPAVAQFGQGNKTVKETPKGPVKKLITQEEIKLFVSKIPDEFDDDCEHDEDDNYSDD